MFKYANVINGLVVSIQESPKEILSMNLILLTNEAVNLGDSYDGSTFTTPPEIVVVPTPIRVIAKRSFMRRFTQPQRIAIRNSIDDIVIDIHEDLKMASSVELDLQDTIDGVNYLLSQGFIDDARVATLLADGTEEEKV